MDNQLNLEIMDFVEKNILPQYAQFGRSHGIGHVNRVIKNAMLMAKNMGVDLNMVYVAAAYHDLGMSGPRAIHHITSGKILQSDARLKRWFTPQQIQIMKEAVEDHRASASHTPRSIYGKIIAEADRDLEPEVVFTRAIEFGLEKHPQLDKEGQWQRFRSHMLEKYSTTGYIKLWISGSPNEAKLKQVRNIIADDKQLRAEFERIYRKVKDE